MRIIGFGAVGALAIALSACGGSDAPEVVEQIVVREPGAATPAGMAAAVGDLAVAGEAAFAMCTGCHVAEAGAPSASGPNLHGVLGRQAGSLDDFAYSEALAGSDITWDAVQLDQYLADPTGAVPGTYMAAGAVRDDQRRRAIIAFLETLSE